MSVDRSVAVVLAILLLMPVATSAQEAATITVAQDGSGDHDTISAAIDAAADGDTILIAPGTYVEYLEIDKDLTISGQGDRADVVIEPPEDLEERLIGYKEVSAVVVWSEDADVVLEGVTLGPLVGYGVVVKGGSVDIRDISTQDTIIVLEDATVNIEDSELHLLNFAGPNETTVIGNTIGDGAYMWDGATATFEDNEVLNSPLAADGGASFTATGNTFAPAEHEVGVSIFGPESHVLIEDNTFAGGFAGIVLEFAGESLVQGNTVRDSELGVLTVETPSTITGNRIHDVRDVGVVAAGNGMSVAGNDIEGGRLGIHAHGIDGAPPGAPSFEEPPRIHDNTITGASHFGVLVDEVSIELSDNVICADREPLKIEGEANLVLSSNDICEPVGE